MSRVGSGRVGHKISVFGGSGSVSKISDRYAIYTQETDYSTSIIYNDKKL